MPNENEIVKCEFTKDELNTIENALNAYWHDGFNNLKREDLGTVETKNYIIQVEKSKKLMDKLEGI